MISATVYDLGFFPGGTSAITYGAADTGIFCGTGNSPSAGGLGFRATNASGLISIGSLFSPNGNSDARAITPDGLMIAGFGSKPSSTLNTCPFTYDDTNGLRELTVGFSYSNGSAMAISPDKSTICGSADNDIVAWYNRVPVTLNKLATFTSGEGLAASNSVVDGWSRYRGFVAGYNFKSVGPTEFYSAVFWTPTSSAAILLNPFGTDTNAKAVAIRFDGTVIAGNSWTTDRTRTRGVLWGASTFDIGVMAGYDYTTILGMSPSGVYVVGYCLNITTGFKRAFVWDLINGFTDLGVFSGENNSAATGITDDGNFISGYGDHKALAWIVQGRPKRFAKITISFPQPINIPCYTPTLAKGGIITKV